jgi:pyridoxal phosphate enzyme (YggS family)
MDRVVNPALADSLEHVRARIDAAAERAGRASKDVTVVAVSKTFGVDVCRDAIAAGVTDLGENRAAELKEKVRVLGRHARWHFVGHLQTNKVRDVVGSVALIHSVDRINLAEAVAARARGLDLVQEVLIEVNVAREVAKHGVDPGAETIRLAKRIGELEGLSIRGLMTMTPLPESPEDSRPHFEALAELLDDVRAVAPKADQLSMGMSRDFEIAVEAGATLVRIGEAIFGSRTHR